MRRSFSSGNKRKGVIRKVERWNWTLSREAITITICWRNRACWGRLGFCWSQMVLCWIWNSPFCTGVRLSWFWVTCLPYRLGPRCVDVYGSSRACSQMCELCSFFRLQHVPLRTAAWLLSGLWMWDMFPQHCDLMNFPLTDPFTVHNLKVHNSSFSHFVFVHLYSVVAWKESKSLHWNEYDLLADILHSSFMRGCILIFMLQ